MTLAWGATLRLGVENRLPKNLERLYSNAATQIRLITRSTRGKTKNTEGQNRSAIQHRARQVHQRIANANISIKRCFNAVEAYIGEITRHGLNEMGNLRRRRELGQQIWVDMSASPPVEDEETDYGSALSHISETDWEEILPAGIQSASGHTVSTCNP